MTAIARTTMRKRALAAPEQGFEQQLADMAFGYVKERSPRLGDFIVGFQLIDRDPDGAKAVGVFGAKAGDAWLYVPTFFLGGKIKGTNLLWLKQSDTFVPNKENWVNAVIARRPYTLGGASEDGDPMRNNPIRSNFRRLVRPWEYQSTKLAIQLPAARPSPLSKAAALALSRYPLWAQPFARFYAQTKLAAALPATDLLRAVEARGLGRSLLALYRNEPWAKLALDRWYGMDKIAALAAKALPPIRVRPLPAVKQAALRIVHYRETVVTPADFSDDERHKLITEGRVIADRRSPDQISRVYSDGAEFAAANPPRSGGYDILKPDGGQEAVIVLTGLMPSDGPSACLVIPKSGAAGYAKPQRVWVVGPSHIDPNEAKAALREWIDRQSAGKPKKGHYYTAVGPDGDATHVFRVRGEDNGAYEISLEPAGVTDEAVSWRADLVKTPAGMDYLYLDTERSRPNFQDGGLSIPKGYKLVDLGTDFSPYRDYPAGRPEDVDRALAKRANLELFVPRSGPVRLSAWGRVWHTTADQVKLALVANVGADEATADAMLKTAAAKGDVVRFIVKYAAPYLGPPPGPQIPYFPEPPDESETMLGRSVLTRPSHEENVPSVGPDYDQGQEYYSPDMNSFHTAQQAARSGQKDVFDVSALTTLLKKPIDDDDLGDMMRTLDGLGRRIFRLCARYDEYEEKYTKNDLPEYEDGLNSVFDSLGDTALFEESRDSRGVPGLSAGTEESGPDMGEASNM